MLAPYKVHVCMLPLQSNYSKMTEIEDLLSRVNYVIIAFLSFLQDTLLLRMIVGLPLFLPVQSVQRIQRS